MLTRVVYLLAIAALAMALIVTLANIGTRYANKRSCLHARPPIVMVGGFCMAFDLAP